MLPEQIPRLGEEATAYGVDVFVAHLREFLELGFLGDFDVGRHCGSPVAWRRGAASARARKGIVFPRIMSPAL